MCGWVRDKGVGCGVRGDGPRLLRPTTTSCLARRADAREQQRLNAFPAPLLHMQHYTRSSRDPARARGGGAQPLTHRFVLFYVGQQLDMVRAVERRLLSKHLEQDGAYGPKVRLTGRGGGGVGHTQSAINWGRVSG